ncbi:hypothetical protein J8281_06940 [Aquimarina sp. U1-2]|uniref:hypothetical protein n=1 Tax=Aquimarina sp. U1-2 TaxID=2823141 RepID=UPI001AECDE2D|nr:hypothetical protein [Aquimarina sp. U1-2]MBP2831921.1 hypothetical protein [Aquimarina sp. U1-2]
MSNQEKDTKKKRFADFQTKYRRSSNFGYGSKRDRFAIAGDGELLASENSDTEEITNK